MEFGLPQILIEGGYLFAFVLCDLGHFSHLDRVHVHVFFPERNNSNTPLTSLYFLSHRQIRYKEEDCGQ